MLGADRSPSRDTTGFHVPSERRLAAILSADAVGFGRLMSRDERATLDILDSHIAVIRALVQEYCGRVVDAVGDNLLAEFSSVVNAVDCAIAIQHGLATDNAALEPERRMPFRIGVNLGDVIFHGERIAGAGVNLAARLERMASPGGICLSGAAFDVVANRIPLCVDDLGEFELDDLPKPIRVYRIDLDGHQEPESRASDQAKLSVPGFSRRPALAVLPFEIDHSDEDQRFFADGITEDLTGRLACSGFLPVIDRNSSYVYRDKPVDVRQVGQSLGVGYVVTGSVRRANDRVRIAVRLVETSLAHQIWSGKYTRHLDDLFDLQDEITETVIGVLDPALVRAEHSRVLRSRPGDLACWDLVIRGLCSVHIGTESAIGEARALACRAIELDKSSAPALTLLAVTHIYDVLYQWSPDREKSVHEALSLSEKAVATDGDDPRANAALGFARIFAHDEHGARSALERALELNPSHAVAYYGLGIIAQILGRTDEAIAMIGKAIRLSPHDPLRHLFRAQLSQAHFVAGHIDQAIEWAWKCLAVKTDPEALRVLAASYAKLGETDRARAALARSQNLQPQFSVEDLRTFVSAELAEHYAEAWGLVDE